MVVVAQLSSVSEKPDVPKAQDIRSAFFLLVEPLNTHKICKQKRRLQQQVLLLHVVFQSNGASLPLILRMLVGPFVALVWGLCF